MGRPYALRELKIVCESIGRHKGLCMVLFFDCGAFINFFPFNSETILIGVYRRAHVPVASAGITAQQSSSF